MSRSGGRAIRPRSLSKKVIRDILFRCSRYCLLFSFLRTYLCPRFRFVVRGKVVGSIVGLSMPAPYLLLARDTGQLSVEPHQCRHPDIQCWVSPRYPASCLTVPLFSFLINGNTNQTGWGAGVFWAQLVVTAHVAPHLLRPDTKSGE